MKLKANTATIQEVKSSLATLFGGLLHMIPVSSSFILFLFFSVVFIQLKEANAFAETFIETYQDYISVALITVFSFIICVEGFKRILPNPFEIKLDHSEHSRIGALPVSQVKSRATDIIYRGAVHEAGHAIAYKLLPAELFPDEVTANVKRETLPPSGIGGSVLRSYNTGEAPMSETYILWEAMCARAGLIAEEIVFGEASLSGASDMYQFEVKAKQYLQHADEFSYFMNPSNDIEVEHNLAKLNDLKTRVDCEMRKHVHEHKDLVLKFAATLCEKGNLEHNEIIELLEIKFTDPATPLQQKD